jgi:aryl-alcohol dehydrogenase
MAGAFFAQSSFATHTVVPQRSAVKVSKDLPLQLLGPLGCGFITGAGSVIEAFRLRPGQSLVVFGAGSVGLAAIMAARIAGAARIVAVDVNGARLDLALALGATEALAFGSDTTSSLKVIARFGFDFSFNTTNNPAVYSLATECLAHEGTAGYVTRPRGDWSPNIAALLAGGRKLQGILGGSANPQSFIPQLLEYWRQGRFPFERLISEFPFADIGAAWSACEAGAVVKPILRM